MHNLFRYHARCDLRVYKYSDEFNDCEYLHPPINFDGYPYVIREICNYKTDNEKN